MQIVIYIKKYLRKLNSIDIYHDTVMICQDNKSWYYESCW